MEKIDRPIDGTQGAEHPFWSPDSKSIGYFTSGVLYRVPAAGGAPTEVTRAPGESSSLPMAGSWSNEQNILFFQGGYGIFTVPAGGGQPGRLRAGAFPQALEGGAFLYWGSEPAPGSDKPAPAIYIASLADPENGTRVVSADGPGVFASGYLLWRNGSKLLAQPFDPATQILSGQPQELLARIANGALGDPLLTVSATGRLIYDPVGQGKSQLTWYSREKGRPIGPLSDPGAFQGFSFFDDGRVMVQHNARDEQGLSVIDERGVATRVMNGATFIPIPSSDNKSVIFGTPNAGLYRAAIDGTHRLRIETPNPHAMQFPSDLSGDILLFTIVDPVFKNDIWSLRVSPDGSAAPGAVPKPYLQTKKVELAARFAPGQQQRWVAYASDESGQPEVYVGRFPDIGEKRKISKGGGYPVWGPNGELYYTSLDEKVMMVHITFGPSSVTVSPARVLFDLPPGTVRPGTSPFETRDGQLFLVLVPVVGVNRPLEIIDNWPARLAH